MNRETAHMISSSEDVWLEDVLGYLSAHFKDVFLPSHDISHHLRVWQIAKTILLEIASQNEHLNRETVEAVMLACLFHDTGMVVTREPSHGAEGTDVYLDFITSNGGKKPSLHHEVLRAIEFHDHKEAYFYQPFTFKDPPDLLTVVSIADDLDALGSVGIYRFTEIYLCREIQLKTLGIRVMENVSSRYNNFVKAATLYPGLIKRSKEKYREIITFFDLYNQQILLEPDPEEIFSGPVGVVNYIRNFSVDGKIRPENFPDALSNFDVGKFVLRYFIKLEKSLHDKYL